MKTLFITAHKYLPQMHGGMQSSTDALCHGLIARGHKVAVLAGLMSGGLFGLKSRIKMKVNKALLRCPVSRETGLGYPVWYTWFPWDAVGFVARREKPDLIIVMAYLPVRMALAARPVGIPILIQLQDCEFGQHGGAFEDLGNIACVANSCFTAEKYRTAYGVNPAVIHPIISADKYRTESSKENVTLINPHPKKGRDIAVEIARRCPEIPFTFVESWPLSPEDRQGLVEKLANLPNVTFLPPRDDMRDIYGRCKILLAPSVWEEGYGRVATEAQVSGIPVIASTRGGLPEAVGPGGILLDPERPIDEWVTALRKLWENKRHYAELSAAALAHAQRPEVTFERQIDAWEDVLRAAAVVSPADRAALAA